MKGNPGKAPTVQWYFRDWLSDKQLQAASPTSRGIWANLLNYMMDCSATTQDCEPGKLKRMGIRQICQLGGCMPDEAEAFVEEAMDLKFCDVEVDSPGLYTFVSRRLSRDHEQRRKWRERKRKQRSGDSSEEDVPGDVPGVSDASPTLSSTSTSTSVPKGTRKKQPRADARVHSQRSKKPQGKHFTQLIPEDLITDLEATCLRSARLKYPNWNPWQWVQYQSKQKSHPMAILDSLKAIEKGDINTTPWQYANNIIKTLTQNYNESDYVKQATEFKRQMEAAGGNLKKLRELAGQIG